MIRFLHAYFPTRTVFLGISEAFLVSLAFIAAVFVRLGADDTTIILGYEHGPTKIVVVAVAFIACMYYFDLYDSSILSNRREVFIRLVQALGTVCILLTLIYYIYPPLEFGRGISLIGLLFVGLLVSLWRKLFSVVNSVPQFADRALILGEGPLVDQIVRECEARPELGLRVVGRILPVVSVSSGSSTLNYRLADSSNVHPASDTGEEISLFVNSLRVNRIFIAMSERRGNLPVGPLLSLKCRGVNIQDGTDVYEAITGKVPIENVRSGWLLFSSGFPVSRYLMVYKRFASTVMAIIGLLFSLPLIPFVALAIRLTSSGPILYRQRRVGRNGVVFYCYKFRTMRADAEADTGPTWAADDDPRVTTVGRFLRLSRLDEIPQLWNVLVGDMSLVGPRPERPEFVERLRRDIPFYDLRHTIPPGITGWAQINYKYGASVEDAKEKLCYDLFYIKNMAPGLDLLIYFRTIKIILLGRGAR